MCANMCEYVCQGVWIHSKMKEDMTTSYDSELSMPDDSGLWFVF